MNQKNVDVMSQDEIDTLMSVLENTTPDIEGFENPLDFTIKKKPHKIRTIPDDEWLEMWRWFKYALIMKYQSQILHHLKRPEIIKSNNIEFYRITKTVYKKATKIMKIYSNHYKNNLKNTENLSRVVLHYEDAVNNKGERFVKSVKKEFINA